MGNEVAKTIVICLTLILIILGISYFIYDYQKEKPVFEPNVYGYKQCVKGCKFIAGNHGKTQEDEVICINECYTFYKDKDFAKAGGIE